MYNVEFIRNENIFKDNGRYVGKRLSLQRDFLEYELRIWGRLDKKKILATIYEDLGFGKVIITEKEDITKKWSEELKDE